MPISLDLNQRGHESFFKFLKLEETNRRNYYSLEYIKASVSQYIDGYYNSIRPHGYLNEYIHKLLFELKLSELNGIAFENFFCDVMKCSSLDFQKVKPYGNIGDRKCDAYIQTTGDYYLIYAPEDIEKESTQTALLKRYLPNQLIVKAAGSDLLFISKIYFARNDYAISFFVLQYSCFDSWLADRNI